MPPVDPRTPCLIGVGQAVWRPGEVEPGGAPEPLAMWEQVARAAAADTGAARDPLAAVDSLQVVYCQSWPYDDPPGRLAERLGIQPRHTLYSGIGGTTPQLLVGEAADAISRGELDLALVTGGEALETKRQLKKQDRRPEWSHRDPEKKPFPFEAPFLPAEVSHDVFQAWLTFAVFDNARRGHRGTPLAEHRQRLGRLLAPMTEVAAGNPYAWFPQARTAEEIVTPTPDNRMVGYPYTKYMISIMDVDMAAALLVASHATADALGVPADRRVYLRGWSYGTDPVYVAERDEMWRSPAMEAVSRQALDGAGVGVDDLAHLDLYSCFTSSVLFARDALGLADDDDRPVTVTGGLPYAGGAGSNYLLHSIATMAGRLRADPGALGLTSGVGMHMTKHSYAVWSTTAGAYAAPDRATLQTGLDARPTRPIRDEYTGPATVAAYSVVHGRDGEPEWGLVVGDLPPDGGDRVYAKVFDADLLREAEEVELVGETVSVVPGEKEGTNVVKR